MIFFTLKCNIAHYFLFVKDFIFKKVLDKPLFNMLLYIKSRKGEKLFNMKGFGFSCAGKKYRAGLRVYSENLYGNEYIAVVPNRNSCGYNIWKLLYDFYFKETHGGALTKIHGLKFSSRLKRELFKLTGSGLNFFVTRLCFALMDSRGISFKRGKKLLMKINSAAKFGMDMDLVKEVASHSKMSKKYILENLRNMVGRGLTFKYMLTIEEEELKRVPGIIKDFMMDYELNAFSSSQVYSGEIVKSQNRVILRGNVYYIQENNLIGNCCEYKNIFKEFLFRQIFLNTNYRNFEDDISANVVVAFQRIYNKRKDIFSFEVTRGCPYALLFYASRVKEGVPSFLELLKGYSKNKIAKSGGLIVELGERTGLGYRRVYDYMRRIQEDKVGIERVFMELEGLSRLMLMKDYLTFRRKKVGISVIKDSFFNYILSIVPPPDFVIL